MTYSNLNTKAIEHYEVVEVIYSHENRPDTNLLDELTINIETRTL